MRENPVGATIVDDAVRLHSPFPRAVAGMTGVMVETISCCTAAGVGG